MRLRYTKHANQKIVRLNQVGFIVNKQQVRKIITTPIRYEDRGDETYIATGLWDNKHVLRVVYRIDRDIIVVITIYPGRRKAYAV